MRTPPPIGLLIAGAALLGAQPGARASCEKVFTTTADFAEGTFFNTRGDAPADEVRLVDAGEIQTFPTMFIANAGEDTVSAIDTRTGREVGRYFTWFSPGQAGHLGAHPGDAWSGPSPSRTAVDTSGNCYVVNRHFNDIGAFRSNPCWVLKLLSSGGIDRNGNGIIDTARDLDGNGVIDPGEMIPIADLDGNNRLDPHELADERIVWAAPVGPANGVGRAIAIAPDGTVWVGLYNARLYVPIDPDTGATLAAGFSTNSLTPFGAVIDRSNVLWSAGLGPLLGRLDITKALAGEPQFWTQSIHGGVHYGIALGADPAANGERIHLGFLTGSSFLDFDPGAKAFSFGPDGIVTYGIAVDAAGNIVCGDAIGGRPGQGASKFAPDGTRIWTSEAQPGAVTTDQRGAIIDSDGNVWTVNRATNNLSKFRGIDGAPLGVYPAGSNPATYSDATGSTLIRTNPTGTWSAVWDAGDRGTTAATRIDWTARTPGASALEVRVAASEQGDEVADYDPNTLTPISNGAALGTGGRYVYVHVRFLSAELQGPVLEDLTITSCPRTGDLNGDCCVDMEDVKIVLQDCLENPDPTQCNPAYDVNGDGEVTIADARRIVVLFCHPGGTPCVETGP